MIPRALRRSTSGRAERRCMRSRKLAELLNGRRPMPRTRSATRALSTDRYSLDLIIWIYMAPAALPSDLRAKHSAMDPTFQGALSASILAAISRGATANPSLRPGTESHLVRDLSTISLSPTGGLRPG